MEFISIFMLLLAAVGIISYISFIQLENSRIYQLGLEAEKILNDITVKINTAYLEGDGFSINLTLPEKIAGSDYTVQIFSNTIIINLGESNYTRNILSPDITGSLKKGINTIENKHGTIIIS